MTDHGVQAEDEIVDIEEIRRIKERYRPYGNRVDRGTAVNDVLILLTAVDELTDGAVYKEETEPEPTDAEIRQRILDTAIDAATDFLYYNRKEDEELPVGAIEDAIRDGIITVAEIGAAFLNQFPKVDPPKVLNPHTVTVKVNEEEIL